MIKNKKIYFILLIVFLALPYVVFGGDPPELEDPLGGKDVPDLVGGIIQKLLGVTGVLALLMFILGGVTWMTSAGNPEKITKGKNTIVWAVFGLAFIFFSYAILHFVLTALIG